MVALYGFILGGLARHRIWARWHDDDRFGMAGRDAGSDTVLIVGTVRGEGSEPALDLIQQRAHLQAVIHVLGGHTEATVVPLPASIPRCSFRHDRPILVPCFSCSHSPAPHSQRPVLSTIRCAGSAPVLEQGRGTSSVSARRFKVEWSETARSSPSRHMTEPINPSVWRRASRNTALKVRAFRIARAE